MYKIIDIFAYPFPVVADLAIDSTFTYLYLNFTYIWSFAFVYHFPF